IYGNILADVSHGMTVALKNEKINAEVDYNNVKETIGADPRIGLAWLDVDHGAYSGAGGFCFPKDMNAFISFTEDLIQKLSSKKSKTDPGLVVSLKKGVLVLKTITEYNKALFAWQGLTMNEVSKHSKDIITNKRKPIRTHGKTNKK
ncbi:MAG: hypothetical protein WD898_00755, partial [Candidatus Paceibacterota bacterium]